MSVFFDPFRSLTNEPFGQQLGSGLSAGGSTGIPGLLSLWNAKTPTISAVGPQILTSVAGNQPDADGNMVPWPILHPGRGVMVQPAYSQMLQNSKLEGAVSGSPGTSPTNWVLNSSAGVRVVTPIAVGNSITFSTTAGSIVNTQDVSALANTTYTVSVTVICDGVFKISDIFNLTNVPAGTPAYTPYLDGVQCLSSVVPAAGSHTVIGRVSISSTAGTFKVRIGVGVDANITGTATFSNPQIVASPYQMPYAASGAGQTVSVSSTAATSSNNGLAIQLSAAVIAALSGGAFTAAALVEMGVSSAQVTAPANILSVNDVAAGLIFADAGGKLKCTDGTNTAEVTVTGGWARTDELLPVVQCDGATFRIGYAKNTFSAITWGSAVEVGADGDWDVVTHERIGLTSVIPFGARQAQFWNVVAEAGVLKVAGYAV